LKTLRVKLITEPTAEPVHARSVDVNGTPCGSAFLPRQKRWIGPSRRYDPAVGITGYAFAAH
jgi:hypothetical protein